MELWDVYDKYRHKTGRVHQRGIPMDEGDYHLVIHVWIVNSKGEFLIQRRQPWKKGWGGMWDCATAGSAIKSDSSIDAVIRESKEEIGVDIDGENLERLFTVDFKRGFDDIWIVKQDIDIKDLILQQEEVADARWATLDEIKEMIKNGEFIAYSYIDRLYNMVESKISIKKATNEESVELLALQRKVFMPLYEKYRDHDTSPATESMERFLRRFDLGDYYKILFEDEVVGSVFVYEISPGLMKLSTINILEEYQGKGISQEVIIRLEGMYPQAYRWELETILTEPKNCYLYEKVGYKQFGEKKIINDRLTLVKYFKEDNLNKIDSI